MFISQIDIAKHYPSSLPTGSVVLFVECCFQNNKNKQKKTPAVGYFTQLFTASNPGWGTHLQEAEQGCAARRGRIFTTGVTIMGSHFQQSYQNGVADFPIFGVSRDSKWDDSRLKNQKVVVY